LWFGATRIDSGKMQIGALTAFLTYLIQILMSVMMATFLLIIAPRAIVCAERIQEVLTTESSVVLAEHPVTQLAKRSVVTFTDAEFSYPGADSVLRDVTFTPSRVRPARHRLDRRRQVDLVSLIRGCST
jgi:ATP-binding cassette subfamily B protein